jgi:cytochrome P450
VGWSSVSKRCGWKFFCWAEPDGCSTHDRRLKKNASLRQRHVLLPPALPRKAGPPGHRRRHLQFSIDGKLQQCGYLCAWVDELFRLLPAITNHLFRTVLQDGSSSETDSSSRTSSPAVPTSKSTATKLWQDPHTFKPERCPGSAKGNEATKK